jgi:cytochrome c biogenesis protein CcmG, thiol:disulfide interchange protein DsbE
MSARTFAVFLGALALVALLGYGLASKGEGTLAVGDPIPTTELPLLGGEGSGSLADQRGRWALVNVWASWCVPCREEAPALQRFYERHGGKGFEIVGIDTQETTEDGLEFVDEFGLTYPQLHDGPGEFAEELKTTGVPENFLVDPDGNVAVLQPGPVTEAFLEQEVRPLIEGGAA